MSYSPYIYQEGPLAYVVPQDNSNYYPLPLLEDDGNSGDLAMFDSMVQSQSPPPAQQLQSPWTPPQQLQRFITEKQKTVLFNASPSLQPFQNPSLMHGVAPLPPASHRQASPLPLTASSSSTCSIALSPAGESDLYHENTPSTPPDYALTSPSYHTTSSPSDMWPSQSQQQLYFSGMGRASPVDACVNPLDVNSTQDTQFDTFEIDNTLDFSPLQRNFSLQSCSSNGFEVEQPIQLRDELLKQQHVTSIEVSQPEIKEEIRIPDSRINGYPRVDARSQAPFEDPDVDADADEDDDHIKDEQTTEDTPFEVEIQDAYQDDSDYQPKRSKRTTSKSKATKRAASSTPTRQSPKRVKTNTTASRSLPTSCPAPKPIASSSKAMMGTFACKDCPRTTFKNEASLMEHRRKQHTRPFVCVFAFAGCESKFAAKNEWKRHVNSQHLLLTYWLCSTDSCAKGAATSSGSKTTSAGCNSTGYSIPAGAVFNRKDLYTQHIRRMHTPPQVKKLNKEAKKAASAASSSSSRPSDPTAAANAELVASWEERLKVFQAEAEKTRCNLPTYMRCPAVGCGQEFQGAEAWDARMEHVAKHLENSSGVEGGEEVGAIEFGGDGDPTLMEWAADARVAVVKWAGGRWVLNNPLKDGPLGDVSAGTSGAVSEIMVADEEDAPGEDEYE